LCGGFALRAFVFPPLGPITKDDLKVAEVQVSSELEKPTAPATSGFANSKACAECHDQIYDLYQTHPMSKSMAALPDASVIEDYDQNAQFDAPQSPKFNGQRSFRIERKGDEFFHSETWTTEDGKELYNQTVPVHYEIGSGQRGRSYLIRRNEVLFMSPITWYSGKNVWDYSPGYLENDLRFERRILDGCVACHVGRVEVDRDKPHRFPAGAFPEPAIGCERCHGPGQGHIDFHKIGSKIGVDPIVNPANLEPRRRESVCNQCHLQGEARILRYGRSSFDFRPGDELSDVWVAFVRGTNVGENQKTDAVSQVEQMMSSRCYIQSQGKFGCISCHDPHSRPKEADLVGFYRGRCLACHTQEQPACAVPVETRLVETSSDSCIHCHMPRLAATDVPHTSQTDHRVLRNPKRIDSDSNAEEPPVAVFDGADKRVSELEINRTRGLMIMRYAEEHSDVYAVFRASELLKPVVEALPFDVDSLEAMGLVHRQLNQRELARRMWNRVLKLDPNRESTLKHMAFLSHDDAEFVEGIGYSDRLIELNPWVFDHFGRKSHMLGELERYPESIEMAHRALKINPGSYQLHEWLSIIYQRIGDQRNALIHRGIFDAVRPKKQN
jgi:predicted CXXCH cytochrome family protein